MGAADVMLSHFTLVYIAVMVCIKVYEAKYELSFSALYTFVVSTSMMVLIFIVTVAWDLSCKPKYHYLTENYNISTKPPEACKGGICWHGVAERSPTSQLIIDVPGQLLSL